MDISSGYDKIISKKCYNMSNIQELEKDIGELIEQFSKVIKKHQMKKIDKLDYMESAKRGIEISEEAEIKSKIVWMVKELLELKKQIELFKITN